MTGQGPGKGLCPAAERLAIGHDPLDCRQHGRRPEIGAVDLDAQAVGLHLAQVDLLVEVLGRADDGHAVRQGLVDGANADHTDEQFGSRQHPLPGQEVGDAYVLQGSGASSLARRPPASRGDEDSIESGSQGLDQLVKVAGVPAAATAGQVDEGQGGVPAGVEDVESFGLGGPIQQRPHIVVPARFAAGRMQLGDVGQQLEGLLQLHLCRTSGQVLVEGPAVRAEVVGERYRGGVAGLVVGLGYAGVVDTLEPGAEAGRGLHVVDHQGRSEHLDEGPLRPHAAVDPLQVVVPVVAAADVLVHPALRQGLHVVDGEALPAGPDHVRAAPGQNDGIPPAAQGTRHDQGPDGMS